MVPARRLLLVSALAFLCGAAAPPPSTARLRIELRLAGDASPAAGGKVTLRLIPQAVGTAAAPAPLAREVEAPGSVEVAASSEIAWRVEVDAPRLWSAPQVVLSDPARPDRSLTLDLVPAGQLTGRIEPPPGEPPPPSPIELRLEPVVPARGPSARRAGPPPVVTSCPVVEGRLRCVVPAGSLDLRFKAAGFAPVHRWGVAVATGEVRDLGRLALRRGSSVVGRVEIEGTAPLSTEHRVHLEPQRAGSAADAPVERRLDQLAYAATVNERGFFEFTDVTPGLYTVTAHPRGFAEARLPGVEVRAGLETEIREPLVLARPVTLEVVFDPPLDPYGQPWHVRVFQANGPQDALPGEYYEGAASPTGQWSRAGLTPGSYVLKVLGKETVWAYEEIAVRPGQEPLLVRIPLVEVRGTVTRGDDPLTTTLWFGGRTGGRRVRFTSDERGRFAGLLPAEGTWRIDLAQEEDATIQLGLEPVEVKRAPGKSYATVAIRVPDTLLRGEVVDEQGRPLPGVLLHTELQNEKRSSFMTDGEGKFAVRGLAPGPLALRASAGERTTGWVNAVVEEKGESPRLRLVAYEQVEYRGRVVSPRGPVAGGRVFGWPDLAEVGVAESVSAVTDPAGEFSLRLPATARWVNLVVLAPGFALRMLKAPAGPGGPLQIPVEAGGGTLVLPSAETILAHGGTWVPSGIFGLWLQLHGVEPEGDVIRVPDMEAGDYLLCSGAGAMLALRRGEPPPANECSGGSLAPYGELSLRLPAGAETAPRTIPELAKCGIRPRAGARRSAEAGALLRAGDVRAESPDSRLPA
jgi:carboxypeptidase family protein